MPPSPNQTQRIKKSPSPYRLLPCWAYVIGLGVNEKVQNTGELMPNFFLVVDFIVVPAFFSSNFKTAPPILLTRALLFFLNIGLTQTCIAIAVPPPTWEHVIIQGSRSHDFGAEIRPIPNVKKCCFSQFQTKNPNLTDFFFFFGGGGGSPSLFH